MPAEPTVPNKNLSFCINEVTGALPAETGAFALPNHILKWYDTDGVTEITPPATINTSSAGTFSYYVSQVMDNPPACESSKIQITIEITSSCIAANNDNATLFECGNVDIPVLNNDAIKGGLAGIIITTSSPGNTTVTGNLVNYRDLICTGSRTDEFTYTACKGSDCASAKVFVTILNIPQISLAEECTFSPKLVLSYQYNGAHYEWEYSDDNVTWNPINNDNPELSIVPVNGRMYRVKTKYNGAETYCTIKTLAVNKQTNVQQVGKILYELVLY